MHRAHGFCQALPEVPCLTIMAELTKELIQKGALSTAQEDTWLANACGVLLEAWVELLADHSFATSSRSGPRAVWQRMLGIDPRTRLATPDHCVSHRAGRCQVSHVASKPAMCPELKLLSCRPVPAAEAVEYPAHMVFDQMVHGLLADAVAGAADDEVSSMSPLKHHDIDSRTRTADRTCGCVDAGCANARLVQRDSLTYWPLQEEEELADEGQEQAALAQVDDLCASSVACSACCAFSAA